MPIFDCGCIVWMDCTKHVSEKIEKLQNRVMRIIFKTNRRSCSQDMHSRLGLLSLYNCRRFLHFQWSFRIVNNLCVLLVQVCIVDNSGTIRCCTCLRLNLLCDKEPSSILLQKTGIVCRNTFGNYNHGQKFVERKLISRYNGARVVIF